jgi:hypothetical protein
LGAIVEHGECVHLSSRMKLSTEETQGLNSTEDVTVHSFKCFRNLESFSELEQIICTHSKVTVSCGWVKVSKLRTWSAIGSHDF